MNTANIAINPTFSTNGTSLITNPQTSDSINPAVNFDVLFLNLLQTVKEEKASTDLNLENNPFASIMMNLLQNVVTVDSTGLEQSANNGQNSLLSTLDLNLSNSSVEGNVESQRLFELLGQSSSKELLEKLLNNDLAVTNGANRSGGELVDNMELFNNISNEVEELLKKILLNSVEEEKVVELIPSKEVMKVQQLQTPVMFFGSSLRDNTYVNVQQTMTHHQNDSNMQNNSGFDLSNSSNESFLSFVSPEEIVTGPVNTNHHVNTSFEKVLNNSIATQVWNRETVQSNLENFIKSHLVVSNQGGTGVSEATITLFPDNLGQVDVKITSHNGVVTAQLVAETGLGRELLESQIQQLRHNLTNQGITVDKIEVTQGSLLSQFDQGNKRQQSHNWNGENRSANKKNETDRVSAYDSYGLFADNNTDYSVQKRYTYSSVEYSA